MCQIPFIILSSKNSPEDIVQGLKLGADDYVTKPFDDDELIARIQAVLRCREPKSKGLELSTGTHEVVYKTKKVILTPREFTLIQYFLNNPDRLISRDNLFKLWGKELDNNTIDTHISNK